MEDSKDFLNPDKVSEMIAAVPVEKQEVARKLLEEIAFMADMLVQLRKSIREKGPLDLFEQGKQKILRENPALKSYSNIAQRYGQFCKQYTDLLPRQQADAVQTSLFDFLEEG